MSIRNYLESSALLLEGVEQLGANSAIGCYCGINVSKTDREPLDQIQLLIAARRIQDYNLKTFGKTGTFITFIGGLFEVLNCRNPEDLADLVAENSKKERAKKRLFQKLYKLYGVSGIVLTTKDLWQDQLYWEILKNLFDTNVFVRGDLINDALSFYTNIEQLMEALRVKRLPRSLVNLPLEFIKKIGNYPAPILYTPAEVSEALYLKQKYGVSAKIGQAQERTYDKYLYAEMSVFRLRQPVSLTSTLRRPETVTPYIDKAVFERSGTKKKGLRLYFDDSLTQITEKVGDLPSENYVFTVDDTFGEVLNPIVEKAIFAIETLRASGKEEVTLGGVQVGSGTELIGALLSRQLSLIELQKTLPELLYTSIVQQVRRQS